MSTLGLRSLPPLGSVQVRDMILIYSFVYSNLYYFLVLSMCQADPGAGNMVLMGL